MQSSWRDWLIVAKEQDEGLSAQQTEALAALSATFLLNLGPPTSAHTVFENIFDETFHPREKQVKVAGLHLPRILSCGQPDGGLVMCGCIAPLGRGMECALFTPIFHVIIHGATGAVDQFQVVRALLQASLDNQCPAPGDG